ATVIRERLPATLLLAVAALVLAVAGAIPLGVAAALRPHSLVDRPGVLASLAGFAVPSVVRGPVLVLVFSIGLGWLPVSGSGGPAYVVLPATTLPRRAGSVLVRLHRTCKREGL